MKQDIHVGGRSFVLEDPNGSAARVPDQEQRAEHVEPLSAVESVRAAHQPSIEPMPNNNDIVGSIRGRGMLAEGIAAGQLGPVALCRAWLTIGLPCLPCIAGSGYLILSRALLRAEPRILPSLGG